MRLLPKKKTKTQREQERRDKLAAKAKRGDEKAMRQEQIADARFYAKRIPNALARMKIASMRRQDKKLIVNKVKIIPPVIIHEDYYMIEIDTARLPYGVKTNHLMDDETLQTLSAACRTQVEYKFIPKYGFWYLVPRRGGLGIIPRIISYGDVIDLMPKSAPIWAIPIGVGENKRLTWIDLRKVPHMLIIGSTGTGKTVFLKNFIFTLSKNVSPKRIRFIIADFKRGPDFKIFSELPHLGSPRPVKYNKELVIDDDLGPEIKKNGDYMDRILIKIDDIVDVLKWASAEVDRRNARFDIDVTNIDLWNARYRSNPMPHIVIVIDEVGVIMNRLPSKEQTALTMLLADIAMLGRSAGIHLVLGLQKLVSKILDGAVSDNIETRIVGRTGSGSQSGMALGNGSWAAANLPKGIEGRIVWRNGTDEDQLQTPWVSPKNALSLLDEIMAKWHSGEDNEDKLAIEIFRWALATHDGQVGEETTFKHFRANGVTRTEIVTILQDYVIRTGDDGNEIVPTFIIDEVEYVLLPEIKGQRARLVITKADYDTMLAERELKNNQPPPPPKPELEPIEIFTAALNDLDGNFSYRQVYDLLDGAVSYYKIKKIGREWENKTFEICGVTYRLNPSEKSFPRKIVMVETVSRNTPQTQETVETSNRGQTQEEIDTEPEPEPDTIYDLEWLNSIPEEA